MEERVPAYYIVSRKLTEEQVAKAQQILAITPVSQVIFTDAYDAVLALKFSQFIWRAGSLERAKELAMKSSETSLIIGDSEFIDACYADGTREKMLC